MIYRNSLEEIVTCKAYFKNVFRNAGIFVFPYIGLGVSNHPINPYPDLKFLDRAYIVLIDAVLITDQRKLEDVDYLFKSTDDNVIVLGGIHTDQNAYIEVVLEYQDAFLQTLHNSQISDHRWIPINTPLKESNMQSSVVTNFFDIAKLPYNLIELLGGDLNDVSRVLF